MRNKKAIEKCISVLAALLVWQMAAMWMQEELLLVSPVKVVKRLMSLCIEYEFWESVSFSCLRIFGGCALAILVGVTCAVLASKFRIIDVFLWPYLAAIKATPVASFIILCLIWFRSESLSVVMSFLMVLPLMYTNVLKGIQETDEKLLEMAQVFGINKSKKCLYIYIPEAMPYFLSAIGVGIGLSWKAGIAAEVIGVPDGSIGEMLYQAKIYLNSTDLFAWTVVIVMLSVLAEKIVLAMITLGMRKLEKC